MKNTHMRIGLVVVVVAMCFVDWTSLPIGEAAWSGVERLKDLLELYTLIIVIGKTELDELESGDHGLK